MNDLDLFKLLIENNADVNCKDPAGYSALHLCAEKGNLEILDILLKKGADPNYVCEGKTPLQLSYEK